MNRRYSLASKQNRNKEDIGAWASRLDTGWDRRTIRPIEFGAQRFYFYFVESCIAWAFF